MFKYATKFLVLAFFITFTTSCTKQKEKPLIVCHKDIFSENFFTKAQLSNISFVQPSSGFNEREHKIMQANFSEIISNEWKKSPVPYNANSDSERFVELKNAIYNDKKYIWALRGGYGSARLLEKLETLKKPKNQKIFIGYSDATFLHLFFNKWGWKTIHGAMPVNLLVSEKSNEVDKKNFTLISDIIKNQKGVLYYDQLKPLNDTASKTLSVEGKLIGGNLTLLTNSLGTKWSINGNNKIIFIEDIHSKGYVIDRDLNHLKQAGVFKHAKAILFGSFTKSDDHVEYALNKFAKEIDIPVFRAQIFGHGKINYPLPFGFLTKISVNSDYKNHENHYDFILKINYNFSDDRLVAK